MPIVACANDFMSVASAWTATMDEVQERRLGGYFHSDAVRSTLDAIRVAGVTYPLRRVCPTVFITGTGEFLVDGFSPHFSGQGDTLEEARTSWFLAVHAAFQELLNMRPFEMSTDNKLQWAVLSSRIDVTVYRNMTPIASKQFGRINKARPYPEEILWENGKREAIAIHQVCTPDFVNYVIGQPIEAIVERDPVDYRLLKIVHIERRSTASRLPAREEAELLKSIGSATALPKAGWK